ncbi:hypothetical protein ACLB1G_13745 [Oxalobacteraceae bacterium A2-2]
MKALFAVAAVAALAGCAVQQPQYARVVQPSDPYQWHTVSVEPSNRVSGSPNVVYSTEPVVQQQASTTVVYTEPVYASPVYSPVYVAPPVYAAPSYYYPPVTVGFDFVFGNWGHRWGGYRGGYRGGYHHR